MILNFFEEIREEAADFFEDFGEALFHKRRHTRLPREIHIGGAVTVVRPAVLFAERIDNLLKALFGMSICLSAFTATFVGFTKLSDLLGVLIYSTAGRIVMGVIGISYMLTAFWKLLNFKDVKTESIHQPAIDSTVENSDVEDGD